MVRRTDPTGYADEKFLPEQSSVSDRRHRSTGPDFHREIDQVRGLDDTYSCFYLGYACIIYFKNLINSPRYLEFEFTIHLVRTIFFLNP